VDRRSFLFSTAALALAPDALAHSLGGTPTALVTADLESHVVAVDMSLARVAREIPTRAGPRSIETVGNDALVAHTADGTLSIVDGARLRVRRVLGGFGAPRYTAAANDGRHAFVTDSERGELVIVDVREGRVVSRVAVGGPARHVTFVAPRGEVWTSLGSKAERVAVVDVSRLARPRLVRRFTPPFLAHDVALGPGGVVWVSSGAERGLVVYRGEKATQIDGDAPPQHVTFLGGLAYVTSGDSGTLRVHSAGDGRLRRLTRVPTGSYNVQEGFGRILTPSLSQGTLCIADSSGRILRRLHVARSSHDACFVMSA
jgi:hypothetical protein